FFFFQAEDGIRDLIVTGVQTCALPILIGFLQTVFLLTLPKLNSSSLALHSSVSSSPLLPLLSVAPFSLLSILAVTLALFLIVLRSEERRVGKECSSRWSWCCYRKIVDS